MGKIFISYSHRDTKALEQLQRFLAPLERSGRLLTWNDNRIEKGDDWKRSIDEALRDATVGVLLISQDFLASEFISTDELPYLLNKHRTGKTKLLPVFLGHSNVKSVCPEVAAIQGYGTPDKPLSDYSRRERDSIYKELSERLIELAGAEPPPRRDKAAHGAAGPVQPAAAYELTVSLQREGENVTGLYRLPGNDPFLTRPVRDVDEAVKPILRALDTNDTETVRNHIRTAADHWGKILYDVLFGTEAGDQEKIFRTAFHQPPPAAAPTAIRAPLHLRIATESADLLGLPWRLTSWNGRLLINDGWVMSTGVSEDPDTDQVTPAPSEVLLVAPRAAARTSADGARHLDAIEQLLQTIWPSNRESSVRRVRTAVELGNALQGQRPHLVYVCAPCEVHRSRPCLMLDAQSGASQEAMPVSDLASRLNESPRPPAVLYLDTHGSTFNPLQAFATPLPLVIWRRLSRQSSDAADVAIAWLAAWLREGRDPVEALHRVCADKAFTDSVEAQTLCVYANYRHWRTDIATHSTTRERMAHLRLDREKQKGVVAKWLGELTGSDTLRVMALVPYSEPGNRLDDVQEQLCHHLDLALDDRAAIKSIRLEFPRSRLALRRDLETELLLQLKADEKEPLTHLLQRLAPKTVGRRRPVLWLHWGIFGDKPGYQPKLSTEQLKDWLSFTGTFIPQHCPPSIRVVCSLAVESQRDKHPHLAKLLNDKHRELDDPKYWLRILEPIGSVAENELFDYLKDDHSGCPPQMRSELAERLSRKTGGKFEALVALIEQAEASSFRGLLDTLQREQRDAPQATDEEL